MAVTTSGERKDLTQSLSLVADFATQTHARALLVLVLVTFISILPGFFSIPPTDPAYRPKLFAPVTPAPLRLAVNAICPDSFSTGTPKKPS